MRIELRLFGRFELLVNGDSVTDKLQYNSARALLCYLGVERGTHSRSAVAGLLWPDSSESEARNNLRQILFKLRQLVGKDHLHTSRQTLELSADVTTDVAIVQTTLNKFEQSQAAADLLPLAAHYRAPLLDQATPWESILYQEWLLMVRERLHRRIMAGFDTLIEHWVAQADWQQAQAVANQQLALDGWREHTHRQLMTIYWRQGKLSAAIAQFEDCRKTLAYELGVEPSGESVALLDEIRKDKKTRRQEDTETSPLLVSPSSPLPNSPTLFIGRKQELATLTSQQSNPACRLLTLVGQGGIGKTRLALAWAKQQRERFTDGVYWVELAGIDAPKEQRERFLAAVADALPLQLASNRPIAIQLLDYLREKQLLLILDNCEQLLDHMPILSDWLRSAPQLEIVATSREKLNLHEEWTLQVSGMRYPQQNDSAETSDATDAVRLFFQRARMIQHDYPLSIVEVPSAARICQLVEGMPLAIELAAGWLRTLSPPEIVQEISQSLAILSSSARNIPARHQSIGTIFQSTWQQLSAHEQSVMGKLSVFRGGFTRQAAEQVAGATLLDLKRLTDRSLIRFAIDGKRYDLHRLLRQFSAEKLGKNSAEARRQHAVYFAEWSEQQAITLHSPAYFDIIAAVLTEFDNIRVAWQMAQDELNVAWLIGLSSVLTTILGDVGRTNEGYQLFEPTVVALQAAGHFPLDFMTRSAFFLHQTGKGEEAVERLQMVITAATDQGQTAARAFAQLHLGYAHYVVGRAAACMEVGLAALPIASKQPDPYIRFTAYNILALAASSSGNGGEAIDYAKRAVAVAQESGAFASQLVGSINLGGAYIATGEYDKAIGIFETCLANPNARKIPYQRLVMLANLSICFDEIDRWQEAEAIAHEALLAAKALGTQRLETLLLNNLGCIKLGVRQFAEAEQLLGESLKKRLALGDKLGVALSRGHLASVYLSTNRMMEAQDLLQQGFALANEIGNRYAQHKLIHYATHWLIHTGRASAKAAIAFVLAEQSKTQAVDEELDRLLEAYPIDNAAAIKSFDEIVDLISAELSTPSPPPA